MADLKYKDYEWTSNNDVNEQLIQKLQDDYKCSGRNLDETELERMDFLSPRIITDYYYPLTITPNSVMAAHYACLQIPQNVLYTDAALKDIVYDAVLNLWEFISENDINLYKIYNKQKAEEFAIKKTEDFLNWYFRALDAKTDSDEKIVRPIIIDLIAIRLERRSTPWILCKCLSV